MPSHPETGGGARRPFPATHHSLLAALHHDDPEERRRAYGTLVEAYWKPVYAYLRLRWQASNEDAQDWTQEFFTRALEKDFFTSYDPSRARFRTFLRVCLDRFLANQRAASSALKRGGDARMVPLDGGGAEADLAGLTDAGDPDALFRREWARSLLERTVSRLRQELVAHDRAVQLTVFERYDLHHDATVRPTYAALGQALGLPVTQVTNHLAAARREFRRLLLEELRAQAGSDAEYRADARDLLGLDPP